MKRRQNQTQIQSLFRQADYAIGQGNYGQAVRLYNEALTLAEPDQTSNIRRQVGYAQNELGLKAYERDEKESALSHFEAALANRPGDSIVKSNTERLRKEVGAERYSRQREVQNKEASERIGILFGDVSAKLGSVDAGNLSGLNWDGGSGSTLGAELDFMQSEPGKDGVVVASAGDPAVTPVGVELFSRGNQYSAPVVGDGSRPGLAVGEDMPDDLKTEPQAVRDIGPDGRDRAGLFDDAQEDLRDEPRAVRDATAKTSNDPDRPPLLEGEALAEAQRDARAYAAYNVAMDLVKEGHYYNAIPYLKTVLARSPDCKSCRDALAKAERIVSDPIAGLEDDLRRDILAMFEEDNRPRTLDELIERDMDKSMDWRSKADLILDALDYGMGNLEATSRYIDDVARAHPDDREARDAQMYIQGLVTGLRPVNGRGGSE